MRRTELQPAVETGILSAAQADQLAAFLAASSAATPRFSFVHVLYYLGGMIAIGAMTLFMTLGWSSLGGLAGLFIAVCYGVLFLALTHWLLERRLEIPAGITATLAVVMVPLALFFAQMALGYWGADKPYRHFHQYIDGRWIMMELGTLAAAAVLLWRYRLPFMLMPVAVTLWYMSMDLMPLLFGDWHDSEVRMFISLWFGAAMTLLAFWVDLRSRHSRDYAFWLYLFGVLSFWGGLTLLDARSEWSRLGYLAINVAMILVGATLGRRVFVVFGGLGVAGYLGDLSYRVFRDSLVFPVALTAIGLAIVWLGIVWQRRQARWSAALRQVLPRALRELIEARAG